MMNVINILVVLSAFIQPSVQLRDNRDDVYYAAVVEFSADESQEENLLHYQQFIKQAKEAKADIIVFPESTLHGTRGDIEDKLSVVPDPEDSVIPCKNGENKTNEVMETLSCSAQENTIYVVVNLLERVPCTESEPDCPSEGRLVHNTNVVFDKNGMVVSRYRKFNLLDENFVNKTKYPELSYFDTDFGVRFGVFTSFDILFQYPAIELVERLNITNFIYPSYWYGELPFLTALQIQSGWSYSMNVNLLASGASKPSSGSGGSGIYIGRKGPPIFSMSEKEASIALIANVPKNVRNIPDDIDEKYETTIITLRDNDKEYSTSTQLQLQRDPTIEDFQSIVLRTDRNEFKEEICSGTFCCRFRVNYSRNHKISEEEMRNVTYKYRAISYKGNKAFSKENSGMVEVCAIILCKGPNLEDCGKRPDLIPEYPLVFNKLSIEADFRKNQTIQMPNILRDSRSSVSKTKLVVLGSGHYDFHTKEEGDVRNVKMVLNDEEKSLLTFGIYSRDFSKGSASRIVQHTLYMLIFAFVIVVSF